MAHPGFRIISNIYAYICIYTWVYGMVRAYLLTQTTGCLRIGPKRDEVTGEWGKIYNEELNDLYCSPNIVRVIKSRRMRWVEHVVCMGSVEVYTGFLVVKLERKRPLGRAMSRWEDNIKMDLQEVGYWVWIGSIWLRIGTGGGHLRVC